MLTNEEAYNLANHLFKYLSSRDNRLIVELEASSNFTQATYLEAVKLVIREYEIERLNFGKSKA